MPFGEYMVQRGAISRFQLLRALQMQDRHRDVRLGECVASLGFLPYHQIEQLHGEWEQQVTIEVR